MEPTLPYLLLDNPDTRLHAETAINGILDKMHGYVWGRGWTTPDGKQKCRDLRQRFWDEWAAGMQIHEAPKSERAEYIERIKNWLASRRPQHRPP